MPTHNLLSNSIIAKEALMLLENQLVLGNIVHRGYEDEFEKSTNGYKPGSSISIRRPPKYTLRTGATHTIQDNLESTVTLSVGTQIGVDLGGWTSQDRTLKIDDFSKRFLKPAMTTIAQGVDAAVAGLYKDVYNLVGTPGTPLANYAGFAKAPQRLDEMAVPNDERYAVLNPADHWGLVGSASGLFVQGVNKSALEKAKLPMLGGVEPYMSQNAPQHTTGTRTASTPLTRGANPQLTSSSTILAALNQGYQVLATDGWASSSTIKAGDVFTINGVKAVNPVSKAVMTYDQQFVVKEDQTANATTSALTELKVWPPIILSGAHQTCYSSGGTIADDQAITLVPAGASTTFNQNLVFHKNAFALAVVPMVSPEGAVDVQRATHNGLSIRMIPIYNGSDDTSSWRLDVLFGVKAIYPDLAVRLCG